jgi:hypothetical protein
VLQDLSVFQECIAVEHTLVSRSKASDRSQLLIELIIRVLSGKEAEFLASTRFFSTPFELDSRSRLGLGLG